MFPPINTREKRKVMHFLDASLVSMLSAPLSKPQFDSTNYLALISRTCSTRIRCQTFSNWWVEQNRNFRVLAARLIRQYEKEPRYKLTNLVITNIFCQSLGPSLYRGCTVALYLILFIYFQKVRGSWPFPSPSPCAGPDFAWRYFSY